MRAAVRWNPIATLQSPTARWPASSSARVTIPTGFVKSTIQAPSAASSRARSAMDSTTGTVRSAFARPPAPVVSWPTQPHASGTVSSESRACWPPTRIWTSTKSAPSSARSRSLRQRQSAREPAPLEHPSGEPADDFQPLRVDVLQGELRHVEPSALTREPGHELRRVGRAAADDRDLHPFTPVRVTPSTKARCARKKTMITGAMKSSVAAIVRFHCTW